ncbi:MAG: hypothetical protein LHV69_11400, partial [Elusimicrobia bacterium]|nr:hypothetical protein [Candidatus Obscuribacterium magneticum]
LVPNLAPDTSGKGIGVRFTLRFGNGGSIINRRASNSPGLFELEQNHSYMDYFVTDQLNREKNPPQEPRGVSIKDPNFDWKIRQMLPEWARERM